MSEVPEHYHVWELTEKGRNLRQYAVAGDKSGRKFIIDFTRGAIGQGKPPPGTDTFYLADLVAPAASVPVKESYSEGANHFISIVIDSTRLLEDILMTEIGVFARLLDADTGEVIIPEVLYSYTYTDKYDYIPTGKTYHVYREINCNTVLSRSASFKIVFDGSKVFMTHKDFLKHIEMIPVDYVIEHNLNTYPDVLAIAFSDGYGTGGYGDYGYGGSNGKKLKSTVEYFDKDRIKISLNKKYPSVKSITRLGAAEYIISFTDSSEVLYVILLTGAHNAADTEGNIGFYPASGVNYNNEQYPEIQTVEQGLDTALFAVKELSWQEQGV